VVAVPGAFVPGAVFLLGEESLWKGWESPLDAWRSAAMGAKNGFDNIFLFLIKKGSFLII
jgi:hypothetical protein